VNRSTPLPFYLTEEDAPAKRAILRAALKLFVQEGFCETTVRDIAAESGYTNPALFKHFANKEDLAVQLFERCYLRQIALLHGALQPPRGFDATLDSLLNSLASALDEDLDAFIFVQEQLRYLWPKVSPAVRRHSLLAQLTALFARGVQEGSVTSEVAPELMVAGFGGLLGQFSRMLYFGEFSGGAKAWKSQLKALAFRMLRP
jgi:TetR/AcrR family transcriptional regulator, repressor of fatR-cypB operon